MGQLQGRHREQLERASEFPVASIGS